MLTDPKAITNLSFLTTEEMKHPTKLLYHIRSFCWHIRILWTIFLSCPHLSLHYLTRPLSPHPLQSCRLATDPTCIIGGTYLLLNSSLQTYPWCRPTSTFPNERVIGRSGHLRKSHLELPRHQALGNKAIYKASHMRGQLKGTISGFTPKKESKHWAYK